MTPSADEIPEVMLDAYPNDSTLQQKTDVYGYKLCKKLGYVKSACSTISWTMTFYNPQQESLIEPTFDRQKREDSGQARRR